MPDVTDPVITPPKRTRKPRAPKPVVERKPRAPVNTLERRVAAMSPTHAEALRILSKSDDTFKTRLRAEFQWEDDHNAAARAVIDAESALSIAQARLEMCGTVAPIATQRRLDALARSIADATVPPDVDPSDRQLDDETAIKRSAIVSHDDPRNFPR